MTLSGLQFCVDLWVIQFCGLQFHVGNTILNRKSLTEVKEQPWESFELV